MIRHILMNDLYMKAMLELEGKLGHKPSEELVMERVSVWLTQETNRQYELARWKGDHECN